MAILASSKKLNPKAKEWKPADDNNDMESLVLCRPPPSPRSFLPHIIYHSLPPQSNKELVVFQPHELFQPPPISVPVGIPYYMHEQPEPQFIYYQPEQLVRHEPHFKSPKSIQCFHDTYLHHVIAPSQPHDSCFEMKNGNKASSWYSQYGEKKRWLKPFLPPRLRGERKPKIWKPLMKKYQETEGVTSYGSYSSKSSSACSSPPLKEKKSNDKTTVMIRNIPNQFGREGFMLFVDHYCSEYHWEYDFLYLPIDFRTRNNMGYAFVNFTSASAASGIGKVLKHFKWEGIMTPGGIFTSKKICEVTWARIQGKEQLVNHFSHSSFTCETDEYLPVVFSPPRNGSSIMTKPITVAKMAGPAVFIPPSSNAS